MFWGPALSLLALQGYDSPADVARAFQQNARVAEARYSSRGVTALLDLRAALPLVKEAESRRLMEQLIRTFEIRIQEAQARRTEALKSLSDLLSRLADETPSARDQAQKELAALGPLLLPELRKAAAETREPETQERLGRVVHQFDPLRSLLAIRREKVLKDVNAQIGELETTMKLVQSEPEVYAIYESERAAAVQRKDEAIRIMLAQAEKVEQRRGRHWMKLPRYQIPGPPTLRAVLGLSAETQAKLEAIFAAVSKEMGELIAKLEGLSGGLMGADDPERPDWKAPLAETMERILLLEDTFAARLCEHLTPEEADKLESWLEDLRLAK